MTPPPGRWTGEIWRKRPPGATLSVHQEDRTQAIENQETAGRSTPPDGQAPGPHQASRARVAAAALHGSLAHRGRRAEERRLVPRHARLHRGRALGGRGPVSGPADESWPLRPNAYPGRL